MKQNGHRNNGLFVVRRSRIQGRGAFATRPIRKGQFIIEYVGERIGPDQEAKRYPEDLMDRHHTFLFSVDDSTSIDAAIGGNDSRFINHSCDPNLEALDDGGRIFIYARKSIRKGEELTYDYSFGTSGRLTRKLMEFYGCRCGTAKCRGTILKIPRSMRKRLLSRVSRNGSC